MRIATLTAALAMLSLSSTAKADDSTPFLATGGVALSLGVANLATAPVCRLSAIRASAQPACLGVSLASGGALVAVGVPLLVVGVSRRRALEVPPVTVQPVVGGAVVAWSAKW